MATNKKKSLKNGWKIFFKYILEYKKEVIILSVLGVISAIANGTTPYITGLFFDAILKPEIVFIGTKIEMPLWLLLIIIFSITQLVADIVDWKSGIKRVKIGMLFFSNYHVKSFGKILRLPISFHHKEKSGATVSKVNRVGQQLISLIENVIIKLAPQFLSIFVGFVVVFFISYKLGLILFFGVVLYVFTMIKVVSPLVKLQRRMHKVWSNSFGDYQESLSNVQTVKKFTSEDYEIKKTYKNFFKKILKIWGKIRKIWVNINFYQRSIVTVTRISIFVISVFLIRDGNLTIGELIAINGYASMVFGPFVILGNNWQVIQNGLINLEETESKINQTPENYKPKNAVIMDKLRGDVEFKNVSFYYNKKDGGVLKNINLKIKAGETIALVGESGVGKSTLVELISAYYFAQKGKILIDGVDIKKINLKFLRRGIAVVPQEVSLFNETIEMNIKYGNLKASEKDLKEAVKDARADEFINKFPKKYKQIVGERGVKLSVGQKQRVAIARAILRDPKILILDEPTSALDSVVEKYITESLKKLMEGRTTFIVAHRLSTIRDVDKIVVFKNGRIVEVGKHNELMEIKGGEYKKLYKLHVGLD